MMHDTKSYQAHRDLHSCGLTQESIDAIKATTVITRDGAQHVVPESQAHLNEETSNQAIQDVSRMLARHKQYSDKRIAQLEKQVEQLIQAVRQQHQELTTIKSNATARQQQTRTLETTYQEEATEEKTREIKETQPAKKGIDRNKVDPAEVKVENIFYSGTR